jgi:hypothetical protein
MRTLRSVGAWIAAGGLMLASGSGSWSQQVPCSGAPCMSSVAQSSQGQSMPGQRSGSQTGSQTQQQPSPIAGEPETPLDGRLEQDQAKMRNLERHKKLVDDTARLVSLAGELKADVDKSNKDTLSLDVIRKADEIEKLAHSVKEKMKGS